MHLIVIVAALLIERMLSQVAHLRRGGFFATYIHLIEKTSLGRLWLARPIGVLVIVPPLAVLAALHWMVVTYLGLGMQLALGLISLLISFGPRDLWEDVYALAQARSQAHHEEVKARSIALCRRATGRRSADVQGDTILGAVLVQGHERVLAVLLWYCVAGPTGAVFYRLVRELPVLAARDPSTRKTARVAKYVHGVIAWLPARIVALLYIVAGHTGTASKAWFASRHTWGANISAIWRLLSVTGRGALGLNPQVAKALDNKHFNALLMDALTLIARSILILLAILAVFTLMGYLY